VVVGCDGRGEELKTLVVQHLESRGVAVKDMGSDMHYVIAASVAREVQASKGNCRGVLFGGIGEGAAIVANKFKGVYAASAVSAMSARLARAMHDANVLALGSFDTEAGSAPQIVDAFLGQAFAEAPAAPGEAEPKWWTPELAEELKLSMPEVGKVEMCAIDEGVQDFLYSANAMAARASGFAEPEVACTEDSAAAAGPPQTPPSPPRQGGASGMSAAKSSYASALNDGPPPTPPPPPLRRR